MNTEDQKIDQLIRESLTQEEAVYYDQLDEKNLLQEFGGIFKGRYAWMGVVTGIMTLVFLGLCVYAAIQFAATEVTKELVLWSLVMVLSFIVISMLKIWNWMQMNSNDIKRELKKVEFQISVLAGKRES